MGCRVDTAEPAPTTYAQAIKARGPQEFGLHSRFTVREFVEYTAWLEEVPQADIPWAARRGIAQAIVVDPRILLVDEPAIRPGPARQVRSWEPVQVPSADTCAVVSAHLVEGMALACTDVVPIGEERLTSRGTPWEFAAADLASGAGDTSTEQRCTALHTRHHEQAGTAR